jgi:hypothetical protein
MATVTTYSYLATEAFFNLNQKIKYHNRNFPSRLLPDYAVDPVPVFGSVTRSASIHCPLPHLHTGSDPPPKDNNLEDGKGYVTETLGKHYLTLLVPEGRNYTTKTSAAEI